jgi:transcriptional regulator with XRE-family HTH domain
MGVQGISVPRFRPSVLLEGRQRAQLTQLELAILAEEAARAARQPVSKGDPAEERMRRVSAWENRIGAWERGIDSPSATYIPTLARVLGIEPLALFDVDPASPPFTALRMAAGLTLQALSEATGISYTSLHRMARGMAKVPDCAAARLAATLGVTPAELRASIDRER